MPSIPLKIAGQDDGQPPAQPAGAKATHLAIQVEGMHCASCVGRVERALLAVPGVVEASVSLATEQAAVRFDPSQVDAAKLVAAIEAAGYRARLSLEPGDLTDRAEVDQRHLRQQREAASWRNLFILGLVLSIPLMLLAMLSHNQTWRPWVMLALATPVQILLGGRFYIGAARMLRRGAANMDTLIAVGATSAYAYSVVVLASIVRGNPIGQGWLYFDGAATILTLIALGKWMESHARARAGSAIRSLLDLAPRVAHRLDEHNHETDVAVEQIAIGDRLRVRPGEQIPTDGLIVEGGSAIDESMLTGESAPAEKGLGAEVFAATLNTTGSFVLRATRVGRQTALARIVALVRQAQESKAAVQRLADRVSGYFVPAVLAIALVTLVGWGLVGHNWANGVIRLTAVLIIACPCALGLATPTAMLVATGRGARMGILIRDADGLEQAGRIDTVVLDKTGTITTGRPALVDRVVLDHESTKDDLLRLAAAAEQPSEHPVGRAIVAAARERGLQSPAGTQFRAIIGQGVEAMVDGVRVRVGSAAMMSESNVDITPAGGKLKDLESQGKTVLLVVTQPATGAARLVGLLAVADTVKPESRQAVARLYAMNLTVYLVSGDNERTARSIGSAVGIAEDCVLAHVSPSEKAAKVAELQQAGHAVAVVGDGINDAPALAAADLGVAIGAGADVAMEAAATTLVGGNLLGVPRAIRLARSTVSTIRQNLVWAFAYNVVGIPVAALFGSLDPMIAAAAMAASSLAVVGNSLRLSRVKLDD